LPNWGDLIYFSKGYSMLATLKGDGP
jgi:hypothetical protein